MNCLWSQLSPFGSVERIIILCSVPHNMNSSTCFFSAFAFFYSFYGWDSIVTYTLWHLCWILCTVFSFCFPLFPVLFQWLRYYPHVFFLDCLQVHVSAIIQAWRQLCHEFQFTSLRQLNQWNVSPAIVPASSVKKKGLWRSAQDFTISIRTLPHKNINIGRYDRLYVLGILGVALGYKE